MAVHTHPRPDKRVDLDAIDRVIESMTSSAAKLLNSGAITPDDLGYLADRVARRIGALDPNNRKR